MKDETIETTTVFGLMMFGADSLKWDEDLFYYRTGVALKLWKKGFNKQIK